MLKRFRKTRTYTVLQWVCCIWLSATLAAPGQAVPPSPGGRTSGGERLISLNFRDAPLDQVLNFYAELTNRTMIKAPGLNATITLRGQSRLTQAEAMVAIESILAMHNVTMVPMGEKFFKVVQINTARKEAMPLQRTMPDEPFSETDHLVSQLVQLRYLEIAEVQPVIQNILHGYGQIQPLERINSLLITDTSANLQRVMEILEYIDRPADTKVETRIYELRYAEAGKIAGRLNELIADAQDKESKPRVAVPEQPATPPGVIRARRPGASPSAPAAASEAELAERGIIQGKIKIVADDRTNILIVISEPANFIFFDKIVAVLDRPVEPEILVRVVALEYADAEAVAGILNEFIGAASSKEKGSAAATGASGEEGATDARSRALEDFIARRAQERAVETEGEKANIGRLSDSTRILADKRTNSLLLMGRKSDVAALEDVIDQLDVMLAQVLIEAVILEVSLSDRLEYGIQWLQRAVTVYNEEVAGPRGGLSVREPVFSFAGGQQFDQDTTFQDASALTERSDFPLSAGALTYYTTFFDLNLDAIIRLVAGSSNARILQTPVILTTDNTEAKIIVGEERPIVTSTTTSADTAAQTSQYEYKNIGVNLTVTPRINPQRYVVMEIAQSVDNVGDFVQIDGNDVPVITKREMQAELAVASRSTIVLGGLINTADRRGRSKVPILGDIPLLGALFRSDSRDQNRTELMVLLTPYVMMTPDEVLSETKRVHTASRASETAWPKGWSDSPLATPGKEELREERIKAKELKRRLREERKKAALEMRREVQADLEKQGIEMPPAEEASMEEPENGIEPTVSVERADEEPLDVEGSFDVETPEDAPTPAVMEDSEREDQVEIEEGELEEIEALIEETAVEPEDPAESAELRLSFPR